MKKQIILAIIIAIATVFLIYTNDKNVSCITDDQCKLIYNECTCQPVKTTDTRQYMDSDPKKCLVNECTLFDTTAICVNSRCVKSNGG